MKRGAGAFHRIAPVRKQRPAGIPHVVHGSSLQKPPQLPSSPEAFRRWRIPFTVLIFSTAGLLSFSAMSNATLSKELKTTKEIDVPEDVSDRYHTTAEHFDKEVGTAEMFMGMGWLRKWLAREASGNVLEMGVGTGRNSRYYRLKECKSITLIDQAPEMIEIARAKFQKQHPSYGACRFVTQSAHEPIQHPPNGFDTVIQTMSVCSTAQPAAALRRLGSITNPEHGRILLLEHGRSHYKWLNNHLDLHASQHADKYGCWWNKDIGKIVEDSGLEVVSIKRYHFGTTWWVELKPPAKTPDNKTLQS